MKKATFLKQLKREGKLELVEPSKILEQSYRKKSENNLSAAKILHNNLLAESVALAYYSMYNMLLALLFRVGIKSENHMASIIFLKDIFNVDNKDIKFAKEERIDKQYYVNFTVTDKQITEMLGMAEKFRSQIDAFISQRTNEQIEEFRKKFEELLK